MRFLHHCFRISLSLRKYSWNLVCSNWKLHSSASETTKLKQGKKQRVKSCQYTFSGVGTSVLLRCREFVSLDSIGNKEQKNQTAKHFFDKIDDKSQNRVTKLWESAQRGSADAMNAVSMPARSAPPVPSINFAFRVGVVNWNHARMDSAISILPNSFSYEISVWLRFQTVFTTNYSITGCREREIRKLKITK